MLNHVFTWLDAHPAAYWAGAAGSLLVLLAESIRSRRATDPTAGRGWPFVFLVLLVLVAWRWPYLLCAQEYNPDESQFIAGAMTLLHDPVFWRSVDGTTSGPLNFYALIPLHVLGLPFDYFTARLTGLLLNWAVLAILYRFFCRQSNARIAALAVLPGVAFFAAATEPDFVHYSSELLALALLALTISWLERRPLAAALIAGLLPWAKLQALPLGGVLVLWQLGRAWHLRENRRQPPLRQWAALAGCAILPSVVFAGIVAACGEFDSFYHRYLLQNFVYIEEGMSFPLLVRAFWVQAGKTALFQTWGLVAGLLGLGVAFVYLLEQRRPGRFVVLGFALLVTAAGCILAPFRPSLHYLLFLLVPVLLLFGAALSELRPAARRPWVTVAVAGLIFFPVGWRVTRGAPEMFGQFSQHWRQPYSPLGSVLRHWQEPGARLAVWGWMTSAYVESGLPQGTRDSLTVWAVQDSREQNYYRAAYLADLQRNQPALFVDATGRGAPYLNDQTRQPHESDPALAAYIRQHYTLVTDIPPARVFVRREVLLRHPITRPQLRQRLARGRQEVTPETPAQITPATAYSSEIDHETVQMVEPATELRWHLVGNERAIDFTYGFHPQAYTEGKSDGADFVVELRPAGVAPLEIFRSHLDPTRVPAQRRPQHGRVELPPFAPGTDLVVRSTPGPGGNTAWDWVYLRRLGFLRSPLYLPGQFPGFNRPPDSAISPHSSLLDHEGRRLLMLSPPAELVFEADGSERDLAMTFGFLPDAYEGNGQTDGATYLIELKRTGGPAQVLYKRRLDPRSRADDRGAQKANLVLPALAPGDRVVVRIDAGPSDSWDWTYVSELELR